MCHIVSTFPHWHISFLSQYFPVNRSLCPKFLAVSFMSNYHLFFLLKSVIFCLPYFSFLLSQIFGQITLFLFKKPCLYRIGLSLGIIFPDANPYIWSYLSVKGRHKEDNTLMNALDCNKNYEQHLPGCKQIQVTFWKLQANLLLSVRLQIPFWLGASHPLQLRAWKKLSLNNDYTSVSHGSPKRKICHFTSTFTVAILTKCPYATSSEHWIYAYLHQGCEQEWSSLTAASLRTVLCDWAI